jgi:hypothetical protein
MSDFLLVGRLGQQRYGWLGRAEVGQLLIRVMRRCTRRYWLLTLLLVRRLGRRRRGWLGRSGVGQLLIRVMRRCTRRHWLLTRPIAGAIAGAILRLSTLSSRARVTGSLMLPGLLSYSCLLWLWVFFSIPSPKLALLRN